MRILRLFLFLILSLLLSSAHGQTPGSTTDGFRGEVLSDLADAERKFVALAEGLPADKYDWRPGAGVRSVGEVLLHISAFNYMAASFIGTPQPAGVKIPQAAAGVGKEQILIYIKESFAHLRGAVGALTEEALAQSARSNPNWTLRRALLFTVKHDSEHLGQLIGYARMAGLTPAWTEEAQRRRQQQPAKQQ